MCGACAREAAGLGFHHRAEVVATPGALLLQVLADLGELFVWQRLVQQAAPEGGAPRGVGIQRKPGGMGRQQRAGTLPQMRSAAGPAVRQGIIGDPGADRVEFDVALAGQHVTLVADQTGLVTAFPKRAGATVAGVEKADVLAPEFLHHPAQVTRSVRRCEQVDVVVHQHVGVQPHAGREQGAAQ